MTVVNKESSPSPSLCVPFSRWFAPPQEVFIHAMYQLKMNDLSYMRYGQLFTKVMPSTSNSPTTKSLVEYEFKWFQLYHLGPCVLYTRPSTIDELVFVRPCYEEMFHVLIESLQNGFLRNICINGTSGVGKRRFYLYCLYRLVCYDDIAHDFSLVLQCRDQTWRFDPTTNLFYHIVKHQEIYELMEDPIVIRLIDTESSQLHGWVGTSILFGPLDNENYKAFLQRDASMELIMPPWTYLELLVVHEFRLKTLREVDERVVAKAHEVLDEKFAFFGGIPRHIFSNGLPHGNISHLITWMNTIHLKKLLKWILVSSRSSAPPSSSQYGLFLHLQPLHDQYLYGGWYLTCSSKRMGDELYDEMVNQCSLELKQLIAAYQNEKGFRWQYLWLVERFFACSNSTQNNPQRPIIASPHPFPSSPQALSSSTTTTSTPTSTTNPISNP
jgi:hypothetical protein